MAIYTKVRQVIYLLKHVAIIAQKKVILFIIIYSMLQKSFNNMLKFILNLFAKHECPACKSTDIVTGGNGYTYYIKCNNCGYYADSE